MAGWRAERWARAVEASEEKPDERIDVVERPATDLKHGPRAVAKAVILAHVPAAAHLQRVLRECMRERRRDAPRRGRIGRDRIAADAADVPEARQVDRRDSKIGRVERTRVQPQALRIDL